MKIDLFLAGLSAVADAVGIISLLVGKTVYFGFFGQNFIASRKWEARHYWSMVAQYLALSVVCGWAAVAAHTAR